MQHPRRQARQTTQGLRCIQIADQRLQTHLAQSGTARGSGGQRHQTPALRRLLHAGIAQTHIPAANDQDALAAKARGQSAQWGLVGGQNTPF